MSEMLDDIIEFVKASKSAGFTGQLQSPLCVDDVDVILKGLSELKAENEKLQADNRELENQYVLAKSILDEIENVLDGIEPSDFMSSFPQVQRVLDYRSKLLWYAHWYDVHNKKAVIEKCG